MGLLLHLQLFERKKVYLEWFATIYKNQITLARLNIILQCVFFLKMDEYHKNIDPESSTLHVVWRQTHWFVEFA